MINTLVGAVFPILISSLFFYSFTKNGCFFRFGFLCLLIFSFSLVTGNKFLAFILYGILCFLVIKNQAENAIHHYIIFLPVFPLIIEWAISLPGIDTVFTINHNRVLIFCLFGPIFLRLLGQGVTLVDPARSYSGVVDRLIIAYILIECFTNFRDFDVFIAARISLLLVVDVWLPYVVISRTVKNVDTILVLLVYSAVMLAILGFLEQKTFVRLYDAITIPMGDVFRIMKIRNGELRVYASMSNPLALGFFFAILLLVALNIRKLIQCPFYVPWVLAAIIVVGIEATGSRSPLVANLVGVSVLCWWMLGRRFVIKSARAVMVSVVICLVWFFSGGIHYLLSFDDKQGTFYYRYELILNSIHIVKAHPFFGSARNTFLNDPILLRSMQGEGIVDITNTYLFIALKSGLISLAIFITLWLVLLRGLCRVPGPEHTSAILMSVCVVTMVMLFISSSVSFIPVYYWLLIALVCGFIRQYTLGVVNPSR